MRDLSDLHRRLRRRLRQSEGESFLPAAGDSERAVAPGDDSFLPPPQAAARTAPEGTRTVPGGEKVSAAAALAAGDDSFLPPLAGAGPSPAPAFADLATALPGEEVRGEFGPCWRLAYQGRDWAPDGPELVAAWRNAGRTRIRRLAELLALDPARVVCLDIETCGLRAVPLFLVGLAWLGADDVGLELLLARRLSEEAAVLEAAFARLRTVDTLVTFNGESFDVPFLLARASYHRLRPALPRRHVDLLPIARRKVGKRFGDCRLTTLESGLCGRRRPGDDLPGARVPDMYRRFTDSGNAALLRPLVEHNAWDLMTLIALAPALVR